MNAIFELLNPSNTVSINRPLAHALGLNEAIIYNALISKFYYYSEHDMLNDGWFYSTASDLAESTALSERQQKRAIDNLVNVGLIRSELRGMPAKRNFCIIEDTEVLKRIISEGEAKMREIKPSAADRSDKKKQTADPKPETQDLINFLAKGFGETVSASKEQSAKISENPEENFSKKECETAVLHCSDKSAEQGSTKCRSKDQQNGETALIKKSIINNLDNINLSIPRIYAGAYKDNADDRIEMIDIQTTRENLFSELKENISYAELCKKYSFSDIMQLNELVRIMHEVLCSEKKTIRVNGNEMPSDVVKSVFWHLDQDHIEYVMEALSKNSSNVRNIRAYLITTLYNSFSTISSYYQAAVNHDLARDGFDLKNNGGKIYENFDRV